MRNFALFTVMIIIIVRYKTIYQKAEWVIWSWCKRTATDLSGHLEDYLLSEPDLEELMVQSRRALVGLLILQILGIVSMELAISLFVGVLFGGLMYGCQKAFDIKVRLAAKFTEPKRDSEYHHSYSTEIFETDATSQPALTPISCAAEKFWFCWDDSYGGGSSRCELVLVPHAHLALEGALDWFTGPPPAAMRGRVTAALTWAHVGFGYDIAGAWGCLNALDRGAAAIAFWTKGDGKEYRIKIEAGDEGQWGSCSATFCSPPAWEKRFLRFTQFRTDTEYDPGDWLFNNIGAISFTTVGGPHESVNVEVQCLCLQ